MKMLTVIVYGDPCGTVKTGEGEPDERVDATEWDAFHPQSQGGLEFGAAFAP